MQREQRAPGAISSGVRRASSRSVGGRRIARTRVMSIRTAAASPKPNRCIAASEPATNPRKAASMIRPAAVTSRPVSRQARRDGSLVQAPSGPLLAHPRDEEHLVHREPAQHGERELRDPALDLIAGNEAERDPPPHLKTTTSRP